MRRAGYAAGWVARLLLVPSVFTFFGIAARHVLHPAETAMAQGLTFGTPVGETAFRAGLGGFPLACAIYLFACLCSRRHVLTGLIFAELAVSTVLTVRIGSMLADDTVAASMRLVMAETALVMVTGLGLILEWRRPA